MLEAIHGKAQAEESNGTETETTSIQDELRFLSDLHRMKERGGNGKATSGAARTRTLKHVHMADFRDEDYVGTKDTKQYRRFCLFNEFARSVCKIRAIARKEIFEAWGMALYVHDSFLSHATTAQQQQPVRRFADLACSHGLLSWAILMLSSAEDRSLSTTTTTTTKITNEKHQRPQPLTAVCIDISMPKSSETAAKIFFEDYPQFLSCDDGSSSSSSSSPFSPTTQQSPCWEYVEGPVEGIVPDASTLLVGIHACGRLSDTIIDLAIQSRAPLALVPCCHSKKILTLSQATKFASIIADSKAPIPSYSLADFMDAYRTQRLIDAGYTVREVTIPEEFTPKNRILLASPPTESKGHPIAKKPKRSHKKSWGIPHFDIPLANTPTARAVVRSISGREAANRRKDAAHPPPAICVSIWLPTTITNDNYFTVEALQTVMESNASSKVRVENTEHKPFHNPTDGRLSKTFRIHYLDCKNNKAKAREYHRTLREVTIPQYFPNVVLRD